MNGNGFRVGTVIEGKYELVRLLGQGGMGEVYEGRHRVIGRRVAVKFLLRQYARQPDVALRFENEARAAGGIEHENVAGVYDVGTLPDGTKYLVMEYLDGEDVDKLVQREAPLPTARAAFIVIQACRGLDPVHQRAIVHRDLKPANLFLSKRADKTDLVKVLDFGIAKLRPAEGQVATRTGAAIGTAYYMSPEQARGARDVDSRSDVYSLGVIFYELLSGKKPHTGESLLELLHKVMTQPPIELESVRPGLPREIYDLVRRAMARDPRDRYQTVAELGDALLPFAGRALPPIRSQPGGAVAAPLAPTAEGDAGAPPMGSVVGVVRSEPGRSGGGARRPLLVAGLVAGVAAVAAVAFLAISRMHPSVPVAPVEQARGQVASMSAAASTAAPAPSAVPGAPKASVSSAPATNPMAMPSAAAPASVARPSGPRTVSEHSPVASASRTAPRVAPAIGPIPPPAPVVPPKPATTDRGDNPF